MTTVKKLSSIVIELPKSKLPAGIAEIQGGYPFFVSGPETKHCDEFIFDGEAVVLSTGGNAAIHFGEGRFAYSTDCWALEPKKDEVYPLYLYQWLLQKQYQIDTLGFEGSGLRHLKKDYVRSFEINLPKLPIQTKIAKILSTLDQAIEQTEAIIAKQQRIKTGLMQDLLTKGIDENGNIRSEATHEFKDSPLGRIPVEWDALPLGKIANVLDPNPSHRNPIYIEDGHPFISTVEFIEPDGIEINTSRRVAEETVLEQEKRCSFRYDSIAFSRKGTIGKIRNLPFGIRFALLDSLCVINAKEGVSSNYIKLTLRSRLLKQQIVEATMGVALPQMSIGRVRTLLIPAPKNLIEQTDIVNKIDLLAENEKQLWNQLVKMRRQKTGLMHDLLTGKVRVTDIQNPTLTPESL